MSILSINEQLKTLPELPGSYQFFDKDNEIIYIGKAKNLRSRVCSYFLKSKKSPKLEVMVPKIVRIEFIITNTEIEALILESHLIKKYKPKYNILLKDDKKFPYFIITNEDYPRIIVGRKRNKNPIVGKYFGPYTDSKAMYSTLNLIKKIFPLKQCKTPKFKDRPCIYYHIGRCHAPCQKLITKEEYKKILSKVELFLSGKQEQLCKALKKEMMKYANEQKYEKAACFRDSFLDVQKTIEKQKVIFENTKMNQDVISVFKNVENEFENLCAISLLQIRQGRLIGKQDFEYKIDELDDLNEIVESFLKEYYDLISNIELPDEIILNNNITNIELYEKWLSSKNNKKVKIITENSKKYEDIKNLGQKNAKYHLEKIKIENLSKIQNDYNEIGSYLKEKLKLSKFPFTVECFDISHIQGTNTVASMVHFENGMMKKTMYRKYKLKTIKNQKPDDFKSLQEVIKRRYSRLLKEHKEFPDLIIIDGGKGQLSSVMKIFEELKIKNQDVISLAKRLEEIFLPNKKESIILARNSQALYFFQRIRDEAHRFAITFHRSLREKASKHSILDEIKGLSEKNKIILLKKYKTIAEIKRLNLNDLNTLIGKRAGKILYNFFHT